ncbi:MAG: gas vesicle protein K [Azospirillaceae bacterium]|nr:gas vesicle protein K [Azospirillaceae bacterium]
MTALMIGPEQRVAGATPSHAGHLSLADALDRILYRGVTLQGNVTIGLADVELLYLDVRLLLGSVDALWPDGRPPVPAIFPRPSSPPPLHSATLPRETLATGAQPAEVPPAATASAISAGAGFRDQAASWPGADPDQPGTSMPGPNTPGPNKPGSSTAEGLIRLVLTLVKLLHDVLERQAVRRMEAGHLSATEIENVGAALFAQAEEILRLQRQFGFSDNDLSLDLSVPDGAL